MTDHLAEAIMRCQDRLLDAFNGLGAVVKAQREEPDTPLLSAWRRQAIREAEDVLAVAQELGIRTNERND